MEGAGPRKAPVQAHVIVLRYDVQVIMVAKLLPERWNAAAQFSEHGSMDAEDRAANTIAVGVCERR